MLKSEQFIRDTFSKYFNGSWTFHLNGMIDSVDTKIQREFGSFPERSCIWAHYRGLIFGSPYIDMVFDDRYHSKSKVKKKFLRKEVWIDGLKDEIKNFSLNPKNDSISFEDNFENKYELIPCAYERSTVIYFSRDGGMCLVYHEGKFNLDNSSMEMLKKQEKAVYNLSDLLTKIKDNNGISFNSGNLTIHDFSLEPVDIRRVRERLSEIKVSGIIHNKFGRIRGSSAHLESYIKNKEILSLIDFQEWGEGKEYLYYPVGNFEGSTLFVTTNLGYFDISGFLINLDENNPEVILGDDNFVSPFYEFMVVQGSDFILNKLSDPLLKDYIREDFDHKGKIDAFIYYLRYLINNEDRQYLEVREEADSFFNGEHVEYLENGIYEYIFNKFIDGSSLISEMPKKDKLDCLNRYKFVTIYGDEITPKDFKSSNVPCFKIYKG